MPVSRRRIRAMYPLICFSIPQEPTTARKETIAVRWLSLPEGIMRMIAPPATGRNVIRVRMWLLIKSKEDLLRSESFYQVDDQHAARQDEDIVGELAGLEPAEEGAAADRDRPQPRH